MKGVWAKLCFENFDCYRAAHFAMQDTHLRMFICEIYQS